MPAGASHDGCPLCPSGTGVHPEKAEMEVAQVTDTGETAKNVYTEDQHFALLTSAVERETASLSEKTQELEAQIASLQTDKAKADTDVAELSAKVDVLEAEKSAAETAAAEAVATHEAYKAELAEKAAVDARKTERVDAIKAAAAHLNDEYFTEERSARWAEMAQEQFDALLADLTEAASAAKPAGAADDTATQQARETAAFSAGTTATATGKGSSLGQFLHATTGSPVAAA